MMIEATEIILQGAHKIEGKPGDTFQLTATLMPENVTLPQVFWRSTNPEIATVDPTGLVTLHADLGQVMAMAEGDTEISSTCKIIAESLYANGPVAEVTVYNSDINTAVSEIFTDNQPQGGSVDLSKDYEVYTLSGVRLGVSCDNLAPGIYIVRQGAAVRKIAVK